ncbi:GntR family transcriptional regulator [Janibacter sp. CX7]|uniref:GntR family transcriptional regulator n=1 Tax=Janibacter sp. CX7 TaxID=2963431 RepID=UPI0020CF7CD8|nr:GntR family transcriptional regulator [Janibacter sp. CX7]UTT65496.1 GntR family transcriptional regulator [Janibacter sp. CX7]
MSRAPLHGPRPKHVQLREAIAELAAGLGPEAAIPSERELMATYSLSRATVRKAIESLIADGMLHRVHGKGTFVARPRLESRLHLASFSQDMRRRGLTPSTRLLGVRLAAPPTEVTQWLGEGRAWRLDRLRLADGQPIALEESWYPADLVPDLGRHDLGDSIYALLADAYGVVIDAAEQTLWGECAEGQVAQLLACPDRAPLLVFRRLSTSLGRPVEHVVSRYRGDRYQLHMSLSRDDTPPPAPPHEGNTP